MTRGACAPARVGIRRPGRRSPDHRAATAARQPGPAQAGTTHDLPGDTFRLLSDQVAYLKLSSVQAADAASYVERAKATRGLIIDIRNYPSEFVRVRAGLVFVDRPTPFARFTVGDLDNPGAFLWRAAAAELTPQQPHYPGKVVVLVDEVSLSQAEYTTMAFRASPRTVVVGSTTAGADGNVSQITLPGGLRTRSAASASSIRTSVRRSGSASFPTSKCGPPSPESEAGRDEVLEEGLRQILGRECLGQIEKCRAEQDARN